MELHDNKTSVPFYFYCILNSVSSGWTSSSIVSAGLNQQLWHHIIQNKNPCYSLKALFKWKGHDVLQKKGFNIHRGTHCTPVFLCGSCQHLKSTALLLQWSSNHLAVEQFSHTHARIKYEISFFIITLWIWEDLQPWGRNRHWTRCQSIALHIFFYWVANLLPGMLLNNGENSGVHWKNI